ncbi:hypothetical protein [Gordonia oryzae]|uniref:hypothetical protein n=1 Tax=Gordonia oryzae TaxID=2487349 RepID=UPI003F831C6B
MEDATKSVVPVEDATKSVVPVIDRPQRVAVETQGMDELGGGHHYATHLARAGRR